MSTSLHSCSYSSSSSYYPSITSSRQVLTLILISIQMNCLDSQRLYRENQSLKDQLKQQTTSTSCLNNDLTTQFQIASRHKHQIQELKHEIKTLKRKNDEQRIEQEQIEHRYIAVLEKLEAELEEYRKKYNKLENKIAPLIDHDTVRLKVLNEVEGNHQLEVGNFKNTIGSLRDEILKFRRENEVAKYSLENERMNHEEEMRRVKTQKSSDFAKDTIDYLTFSMWKDMEAKLTNSYNQARKEAEFYKEKYFAVEKKYHARALGREGGYLTGETD